MQLDQLNKIDCLATLLASLSLSLFCTNALTSSLTFNVSIIHANSNLPLNQDPASKYYIHPSDANSTQLVSTKFNGTGFANWKRAMKMSLSARNKLGFVNGKIARPAEGTAEFEAWERCNDLVSTWLINNLDGTISQSVLFLKSAFDIWNNLETRFGFIALTELFSLEQKLASITQGTNSISEFFTEIKTVWDALEEADPIHVCTCENCTCNATQKNQQRQARKMLMQFMMKLKDEYSTIRGNILMMKPVPDVTEAYRVFAQEESHKNVTNNSNTQQDTLAFYADKRRFNDQRFSEPSSSSWKGNSYNSTQGNNQRHFVPWRNGNLFCTFCKMSNHTVDRCYKLHGFPNDGNKNKKVAAVGPNSQDDGVAETVEVSADQYKEYMEYVKSQGNAEHTGGLFDSSADPSHAMIAGSSCLFSCSNIQWLLDSGATDHMCYDLSYFSSYSTQETNSINNNNYITIPNGSRVPIKYVGTVKLNNDIVLEHVLYVPDFKFNLISVHKLCKDLQCELHFSHDKCYVIKQKGSTTLLGRLTAGLYRVATLDCKDSLIGFDVSLACNSVVDSVKLWHLRLGHMPFAQMKFVDPSFTIKSCPQDDICQICPQARQNKLPFSLSTIKTTKSFELIHVDTWGPLRFSTHTGCKFFLTIVDDFTRFTWIHLMKNKSEAVSILYNFALFVKNQFNSSIKVLRSDNAKELCEGEVKKFYDKLGILHQTSCIDTPEQNGVVERKHRHLLETTRALYLQSRVPDKYWGECLKSAVFLINRMPLKVINSASPYEKLFGSKPDLSILRAFGCLCYVTTSKVHRHKLAPRESPSIFLGYSTTQKGYCVLDLKTKKLHVSRNVKFHERHFPFQLFLKNKHPSQEEASHLFDIYLPTMSVDPFCDTQPILPKSPNTISVSTHLECDTTSNTSSFENLPSNPVSNTDMVHNAESQGSDDQPTDSQLVSSAPDSILSLPTSDLFQNSTSSSPLVVDFSSCLPTQSTNTVCAPRKSSRSFHPPSYLKDYHCYNASSSHWCNLVQFSSYSSSHQAFLADLCNITEPQNYHEASKQQCWVEAMNKEINALHANHTWVLTDLPPSKKPIGSKWVYKVKLKVDGTLERCKARLVAQGYRQKHGVDFSETFSPVVKMNTIRCLLALAAARKWSVFQLDVNNAFPHGDLKEEVYMKVPEGVSNHFNQVCKLTKSLYGLKQASRQWFAKLVENLVSQGFQQSKNDYSMFIKRNGSDICIAAVYVDDILLTGTDISAIQNLKYHFHTTFSIKDLGQLHYFLGMEVDKLEHGFLISQNKFTRELLETCALDLSKKASTPLPLNLKLQAEQGSLLPNPELYRTLVGKLNFLTNTRPDLAFAVQTLSQFMHSPTTSHLDALHHTLRYVAGTAGQGILLQGASNLKLQAFSDSDWGACVDTRRSVTGYVLMLGNSPISWKSKKKNSV